MITMLDCGDQAIQADTPHLFEHLDLAPHYIDFFINATETQSTDNGSSCNDSTNYEEDEFNGDSYMGGIAFLAGTHKLEICTMCMPEHENGYSRTEKLTRIIRPSLELGDALLFDCRILYFGLTNNSQAANNSEVFSSSIASKPNCITRRSQTFYTKIKRKQLVHLCEKEGLNSKGSDKVLESRHRAFVTLVNSECDASLPRSCKEIVKMVHDRERSEMVRHSIYFALSSYVICIENNTHPYIFSPISFAKMIIIHQENAKASLVDGTSRHSSYTKKIYERKDDSKNSTITDSRSLSRDETAFDKELSNGFKHLIAETRRKQQLQKKRVVLTTEKRISCDHLPAVVRKSVSASVSSDLGCAIDDGIRSSEDDFLESPSRVASSVKRVGHNTISNGLSSQSVNEERHNLRQKQVPDDYPVSKVARSEPGTHVAKRSRFSTTKSNMISQVQPIHKKKSVTGIWQCSKCTYINKVRKWSSAPCEMCDNPREDNSEVAAGVNANAATSSSKYFQIDC